MTNKFKIQGPFSHDDDTQLYWSNKDGWVDFQSATTFTENQRINLPMDTELVAWLKMDGTIDHLMNPSAFYSIPATSNTLFK